jgi:hypothetical protein
LFSIYGNADLN